MLLSRKLKADVLKAASQRNVPVECYLKNILINGTKRGTSGFIVRTDNKCTVYVNTEHSCYGPISEMSLYRYAANTHDYGSNGLTNGFNHFVEDGKLAETVVDFMEAGIGVLKE